MCQALNSNLEIAIDWIHQYSVDKYEGNLSTWYGFIQWIELTSSFDGPGVKFCYQKQQGITPEMHKTACADPWSLYCLWSHWFRWSRKTWSFTLCRVKRSFKPYHIQSRRPKKKAKKNHAMLTRKSPWKSCSTTHLPFLASNPKILKAFPKLNKISCWNVAY